MTTAPADFVDLAADEPALRASLARMGLAGSGTKPCAAPLTGGVSSSILRVAVGDSLFCVKQALPRLKVEKDWRVPVDRVFAEIAWLELAGAIAPGHVPRILGVDRAGAAFAMEFLDPDRHPNWKQRLLAGEVDAGLAADVGDVLGRIHAATAADASNEKRFANDANFFALRLEPYLLEAARQHPERARELVGLVQLTLTHPRVVVHGDVSPKNILLGPQGPVLLDAECACWGDPAFDLAFVLNHLLIKAVHRADSAAALDESFRRLVAAYDARVDWEPRAALLARTARLLPGMMLARIDGKSPVEYLAEPARARVRAFALEALGSAADSPYSLLGRWQAFRSAAAAR